MSRLIREQEQIIKVIREIEHDHPGVYTGNIAISGSGSMVMHSIDRGKTIGDIDLFCTTEVWLNLFKDQRWLAYIPSGLDHKRRFDPAFLYQKFSFDLDRTDKLTGVDTIDVNVFAEWRKRSWGNINVHDLFSSAVVIEKVSCVGLEWLLNWKREVERPKDLPDIELIEDYLERE